MLRFTCALAETQLSTSIVLVDRTCLLVCLIAHVCSDGVVMHSAKQWAGVYTCYSITCETQ